MCRKYIVITEINNIVFAIDKRNMEEITKLLNPFKGDITKNYFPLIAQNKCPKDKYSFENYKSSIKNITALKFKAKHMNNARIYCQDFRKNNTRYIILCEPYHSKKQTKISDKEKAIIKKVNTYIWETKNN